MRRLNNTVKPRISLSGLSDEESKLIEIRLALAGFVRKRRLANELTQTELATLVNSTQSRVAKMEAGDSSVSMDFLLKALLAMQSTKKEIAIERLQA